MWIQVRTMDGKVAHSVGSLSRLTKVEELREKIQELFHVEPGRQRLFYRGKQVNPPCRLPAAQHLCSCLVQALLLRHRHVQSPPPPSGPASCLHRKLPMPEPGTKARLTHGHTGQAAGAGICSIWASYNSLFILCSKPLGMISRES